MKTILPTLLALSTFCAPALAVASLPPSTVPVSPERMEWFEEAKFGVFIHWGIYAVRGEGESWPMFNGKVSREDYYAQQADFTASQYDAGEWAALFKEAGAKYAVLTTKHHDGVALWDTQANDLSVVQKTPAKRDLVAPFVEALHEAEIKVGLYYSWLDWAVEDYFSLGFRTSQDVDWDHLNDQPTDPAAWKRFQSLYMGQLEELLAFDPDLLWFDGQWHVQDHFWEFDKVHALIRSHSEDVILNERIPGFADYHTPEQTIPFASPPGIWELCMTMDAWGSWGVRHDYKEFEKMSGSQLIRILAECAYLGGNLLLNVSPFADGSIPDWQARNLREIGAFLKLNGEGIYGTRAGIHRNHYGEGSTLSSDRKTLYLFVFGRPENSLMLKGIVNDPKRITILGEEEELQEALKFGSTRFGRAKTRYIDWPEDVEIGSGRIVKIEFEEPLRLYTGESGQIKAN